MKLKLVLTIISCLLLWHVSNAQSILSGTIYDVDSKLPLSAVLIRSNKKQAVIADRSGYFKIQASVNDLLIFTLTGYQPDTLYLTDLTPKKVGLISTTHLLSEVKISANSAEETFNPRKDYPEVYEKSRFALSPSRLFGKEARNARRLKRYFENEEKQRKIDSLFNKRLVGAIIPLKGAELRNFMSKYRPTLSFLTKSSPDQLSVYIKERYQEFLELPKQQQTWVPLH